MLMDADGKPFFTRTEDEQREIASEILVNFVMRSYDVTDKVPNPVRVRLPLRYRSTRAQRASLRRERG